MTSQLNKNNIIKILSILLILIISIIFIYQPIFKIKFGGGDNLGWYEEAQERDTLQKIIDYKYHSRRIDCCSYFNPIQLSLWRYMVTHYDKNPYPYHLLSILIHIINTVIVFFLLKIFIKNNFFSFLAALSFAIYYLNFKTVGWIAAGITTGLSVFFILLTFFLVIKYFQTKNKLFYFSSFLTYFLGIFTKEYVLFTIPILFAYYLIFEQNEESRFCRAKRGMVLITQREKILKITKKDLFILPYLMLSLPLILISLIRVSNSAVVNRWGGLNFGIHILYRFIDFVNYLITIVPGNFLLKMIVAIFILFIFPVLIYFGLKDKNLLFLTAWLVLSVTAFIFSNFRDIYSLGRYLYLPSIAWFGLLYYITSNIKNKKIKIITSFCLINYTVILNIFLILIKR